MSEIACGEESTSIITTFVVAKKSTAKDTKREMAHNEEETKINFVRGWVLINEFMINTAIHVTKVAYEFELYIKYVQSANRDPRSKKAEKMGT